MRGRVVVDREVVDRWVVVALAVVAVVVVCLASGVMAAVSISSVQTRRAMASASASASAAGIQLGAPCPADVEHLEEILAIGEGHELPEGAQVTSVRPAERFAERISGGWGYVIEFTASEQAIRDYAASELGHEYLDARKAAQSDADGAEDVDLNSVTNPWVDGFGDTKIILERPLGRGWMVIRGGGR